MRSGSHIQLVDQELLLCEDAETNSRQDDWSIDPFAKHLPNSGARTDELNHWWHLLGLERLEVGKCSAGGGLHEEMVGMWWEAAVGSSEGTAGSKNSQQVRSRSSMAAGSRIVESAAVVVPAGPGKER